MTGFNHGLTGVVIGLAVKEPFLALPLAFISHFVCDVIPHFGLKAKKSHQNNIVHLVDLLLILSLITFLLITNVGWVPVLALVLAGSPDFAWLYRYEIKEKWLKQKLGPMNKFNAWHAKIQWSETVWPGALVEAIYATVMLIVLSNLL